jgi:hypothetical protein
MSKAEIKLMEHKKVCSACETDKLCDAGSNLIRIVRNETNLRNLKQ